jgi:hypothetical protein
MRKFIALAAIFAVTSTHAAQELKFGDANYFLKQGQIGVNADFNQMFFKEKNFGTNYVSHGYNIDTNIGYALTDKLNAFVGLQYALQMDTEDKTTTTNGKFYNDGLANPAVGANYRYQNQNEARYNVDFGAVARLKFQDAQRGSSSGQNKIDGNNTAAANSLELNARMGRKWNEANEWQFAVGGIYKMNGEYTAKQTTGDVDVSQDSALDLYLRATYQYRPVNEFMFLLSAQATQVGEQGGKISGGGGKLDKDSHIDMDLRFVAKYLITETLIGRFNYGAARLEQYDVKKVSSTGSVNQRFSNFFGLGVDLLF